ncbi:MAG: type I methionyl aminopeptidase [Spirochaetaceae bacterium]|jgi:methionyl aminopeptidase|nr:type I methionyl aminopeptidase [Spirochaetaceae bacterium]
MNLVKTNKQIKQIKGLAHIISGILEESILAIKPGMTTGELDTIIEKLMKRTGVTGPCKGFEGYPNVSCLSMNDCITHGVPGKTLIHEGDILDVDIVIERNGYFADISKTIGIGLISEDARKIITTAESCLAAGIKKVRPGARLGDIGFAIQSHAQSFNYSIVREYCGHFIGTAMHEGPQVTNYGDPNQGFELKEGMILCIEPMINEGRRSVKHDSDGWTARTRDGKLSSRCEHMVLVTKNGHEVLTVHPDLIRI